MIIYQHLTLLCFYCHISFYNVVFSVLIFCVNNIDDKYTNVTRHTHNEQGQFFLKYASLWARVRNRLKGFLSKTLSTSLVPSYRVSLYLCSFYNRNTGFSFFVYFSLIVSFIFASYKNRQNGLQLQSSLQNNLPENLYNSACP